jgi:hypothetical protein
MALATFAAEIARATSAEVFILSVQEEVQVMDLG